MKKRLIIIALLYFVVSVSAWWIFDDDEQSAIPRIDIGKDEYLFNLSGFVCSDILSCTLWSNDSFYHDYISGFNWTFHVNETDRTNWNSVNGSENVTFDYVTATGFIGDGSQLTNVGLTEETAVTLSTKAGENIDKGECVFISGAVGQIAQVNLCDNTDGEKDHPIGLSAETKTSGQTMLVRVSGLITTLDTSAWNENDTLYVNSDGSLTNVYPTSGVVIEIAHVTYSHVNNGRLLVHMHTPRDYLSTSSGGKIDLRLGDSVGATCVEFENYTDGDIGYICSSGSTWFALHVNTTAFYQNDEPMFDYSDILGIANTTAKWGYAGEIPLNNLTNETDLESAIQHMENDGSEHSFIDQSVVIGSKPDIDGVRPSGAFELCVNGDTADCLIISNPADAIQLISNESLIYNMTLQFANGDPVIQLCAGGAIGVNNCATSSRVKGTIFQLYGPNGSIIYEPRFELIINATHGTIATAFDTNGDIIINPAGNNIIGGSDNTILLGQTVGGNVRWADVKSVLINGADICFENNICMTECINDNNKIDICFVYGKPTTDQRITIGVAGFENYTDYRGSHMQRTCTENSTNCITEFDNSMNETEFYERYNSVVINNKLDFTFNRTVRMTLRDVNNAINEIEDLQNENLVLQIMLDSVYADLEDLNMRITNLENQI